MSTNTKMETVLMGFETKQRKEHLKLILIFPISDKMMVSPLEFFTFTTRSQQMKGLDGSQ